jgi:hypothetical protein
MPVGVRIAVRSDRTEHSSRPAPAGPTPGRSAPYNSRVVDGRSQDALLPCALRVGSGAPLDGRIVPAGSGGYAAPSAPAPNFCAWLTRTILSNTTGEQHGLACLEPLRRAEEVAVGNPTRRIARSVHADPDRPWAEATEAPSTPSEGRHRRRWGPPPAAAPSSIRARCAGDPSSADRAGARARRCAQVGGRSSNLPTAERLTSRTGGP